MPLVFDSHSGCPSHPEWLFCAPSCGDSVAGGAGYCFLNRAQKNPSVPVEAGVSVMVLPLRLKG